MRLRCFFKTDFQSEMAGFMTPEPFTLCGTCASFKAYCQK